MKLGIIGAGATGLTAAFDAVRAGHEVTVLEASSELGGLAASLEVGGTPLERFYHHCFASDHAMIQLIDELGISEKLHFYQPPTGVYWNGELHAFGTPREMLSFPAFSLLDRLRFGASAAMLKMIKKGSRFNEVRALGWMRKWAGKRVTETIWEPLLVGKFGEKAADISMAWLWARIHYRTFGLGYLDGGFDQVYRALAEAITQQGGRILFDSPMRAITQAGDIVEVQAGKRPESPDSSAPEEADTHQFDRVIVTVPQPIFAKAAGLESDDMLWRNQYLGASCFVLELDHSLIPHYWLNINDTGFPFLAVVEHTRMVDRSLYNGKHVVYVGNYVPRVDWRFTTDPEELLEHYIPYLQKLNPEFSRDWISNWHFSKAPFAQPIVTPEYRSLIPAHETHLPGVTLATMSQIYPQDRGQSYAIEMGRRIAAEVLGG